MTTEGFDGNSFRELLSGCSRLSQEEQQEAVGRIELALYHSGSSWDTVGMLVLGDQVPSKERATYRALGFAKLFAPDLFIGETAVREKRDRLDQARRRQASRGATA